MRELKTIQTQGKLNEVWALDEAGAGGACHRYCVLPVDPEKWRGYIINFQHGPKNDPSSIQGVLDTDLLEIVRDRLTAFQQGEFANEYDARALHHIEEALHQMNRRVEDRLSRGVLGTMEK